jgi:hypothetical protein
MRKAAGGTMEEWVIGTLRADADLLGRRLKRLVGGEWQQGHEGPVRYFVKRVADEAGPRETKAVARAVSAYLTVDEEAARLAELVDRRYRGVGTWERSVLVDRARRVLRRTPRLHRRLRRDAERQLEAVCRDARTILADGAATFLLEPLVAEWERAVDEAMDAWILDREDQEAVHWMQRYRKETRGREAGRLDVVAAADDLVVLDADGTCRYREPAIEAGENLLAAMLVLAPDAVVVHGSIPGPVSRWLAAVFEDDLAWCAGCPRCRRSDRPEG